MEVNDCEKYFEIADSNNILLIGYYLYFNMPWILQYKERESSMVTEYYRKGSLQYDIITGNYVFARIKVLFGENVNEIDKKN